MSLTDFLLARMAEDEASNGCLGEGEYETCFRRSERIDRECEAKRRIVEMYASALPQDLSYRAGLEVACMALALPYADHEDYHQGWKL